MVKEYKNSVDLKKETYEEYCKRCEENSVKPLPLEKWEALNDIKNFKFIT